MENKQFELLIVFFVYIKREHIAERIVQDAVEGDSNKKTIRPENNTLVLLAELILNLRGIVHLL